MKYKYFSPEDIAYLKKLRVEDSHSPQLELACGSILELKDIRYERARETLLWCSKNGHLMQKTFALELLEKYPATLPSSPATITWPLSLFENAGLKSKEIDTNHFFNLAEDKDTSLALLKSLTQQQEISSEKKYIETDEQKIEIVEADNGFCYKSIPVERAKIPSALLKLSAKLKELTSKDIILRGSTVPNIHLEKKHHDWDLWIEGFDQRPLFDILNTMEGVSELENIQYAAHPIIRFKINVDGHEQLVEIATLKKEREETLDDAIIKYFNLHGEFNISSLYMILTQELLEIRGSHECVNAFLDKRINVINHCQQLFLEDPKRFLRLIMKLNEYKENGFELDPELLEVLKIYTPKECFAYSLNTDSEQKSTSAMLQTLFSRFDDPVNAIQAMDKLDCIEGLTETSLKKMDNSLLEKLHRYKDSHPYTQRLAFYVFMLAHFCAQHAEIERSQDRKNVLANWQLIKTVEEIDPMHYHYLNNTVNKVLHEHADLLIALDSLLPEPSLQPPVNKFSTPNKSANRFFTPNFNCAPENRVGNVPTAPMVRVN